MSSDDGNGRRQKILLGASLVILILAGALAWSRLGGKSAADIAANRAFIDIETGDVFEHTISMGESYPVESPFTKRATGYRAEACYWTKDENGQWAIKDKPTLLLVKKEVDPTTTEKTYCPDCGREVVRHNPVPTPEAVARANGEASD